MTTQLSEAELRLAAGRVLKPVDPHYCTNCGIRKECASQPSIGFACWQPDPDTRDMAVIAEELFRRISLFQLVESVCQNLGLQADTLDSKGLCLVYEAYLKMQPDEKAWCCLRALGKEE